MRTLGKRVGRVIGLGGSNPPGSASHQKTGKARAPATSRWLFGRASRLARLHLVRNQTRLNRPWGFDSLPFRFVRFEES